jgi:putative DNA primase/helicase
VSAKITTLPAGRADVYDDSEIELADCFVRLNIDTYRSVPGIGVMEWDGSRWRRDLRLRQFDDVRRYCHGRGILATSAPDTKRVQTAKVVAAVVTLMRADQRIVALPDEFDADRMMLNTPSGIVNLRTLDIVPHARQLVTKRAGIAPSFDEPTRWLQFLADVFEGDDETIAFMRRLCGYLLTGEVSEQIVIFMHGKGANGKSTMLDVLLYILGDYALKVPAAMLMAQRNERHPTDVAQLAGVRVAVANEISQGAHWDEARIKELSGDIRITARFMRQDFFQFDATHTFLVSGNSRPRFRVMDHAMRRRLVLVPFRRRFEGAARDLDMLAKLKAEASAILGWMAIGASLWAEDGLQIPASIRKASNDYCDAMDTFALWLAECCDLAVDANESSTMLYRSYSAWKQRRGESPVSQTLWGEEMSERDFESYRNNGIRYHGISLTVDERHRALATADRP